MVGAMVRCALVMLVLVWSVFRVAEAPAQTVPDELAKRIGARVVEAINTPDPETRSEAFASLISDQTDTERVLGQMEALPTRLGTLDYHHAEVDEFREGPSKLLIMHLFARAATDGEWRDIQLMLHRLPPHGILRVLDVERVPEPVNLPNMGIQLRSSQAWLREYARELRAREGLTAALSIEYNGVPIVETFVGFEDAERARPLTPSTRMRLARGVEVLIATGVALLVEDGRLSFDAPVAGVVDELRGMPALAGVSVGHVLSHSTGLRAPADLGAIGAPRGVIPLLRGAERTFEPGSSCEVSDLNLLLGALIIESRTDGPFERFVSDRILDGLGMSATVFGPGGAGGPGWAEAPSTGEDVRALPPALRAWSTARDMMAFASALAGGRLVSGDTLEAMTEARAASADEAIVMGYGFRLARHAELRSFGHESTAPGGSFELRIVRARRTVIMVAMTNEHSRAFDALTRNSLRLIAGGR